jgi:hypothetical protein
LLTSLPITIFAEKTQAYVESCYGYASTDLAAELHRQHGHGVRFNDSPEYPQIVEILEQVVLPKPTSQRVKIGANS